MEFTRIPVELEFDNPNHRTQSIIEALDLVGYLLSRLNIKSKLQYTHIRATATKHIYTVVIDVPKNLVKDIPKPEHTSEGR